MHAVFHDAWACCPILGHEDDVVDQKSSHRKDILENLFVSRGFGHSGLTAQPNLMQLSLSVSDRAACVYVSHTCCLVHGTPSNHTLMVFDETMIGTWWLCCVQLCCIDVGVKMVGETFSGARTLTYDDQSWWQCCC